MSVVAVVAVVAVIALSVDVVVAVVAVAVDVVVVDVVDVDVVNQKWVSSDVKTDTAKNIIKDEILDFSGIIKSRETKMSPSQFLT